MTLTPPPPPVGWIGAYQNHIAKSSDPPLKAKPYAGEMPKPPPAAKRLPSFPTPKEITKTSSVPPQKRAATRSVTPPRKAPPTKDSGHGMGPDVSATLGTKASMPPPAAVPAAKATR